MPNGPRGDPYLGGRFFIGAEQRQFSGASSLWDACFIARKPTDIGIMCSADVVAPIAAHRYARRGLLRAGREAVTWRRVETAWRVESKEMLLLFSLFRYRPVIRLTGHHGYCFLARK